MENKLKPINTSTETLLNLYTGDQIESITYTDTTECLTFYILLQDSHPG